MSRLFEIGPFRLDLAAGVLSREGKPAPLGPRAVAVLAKLVENADAVVAKAAIIDAAWPGLVVQEANLTVQIAAIRRVLGRGCIETLPRRGYRFTGPVRDLALTIDDEPQPAASSLPTPLTSFVGRERELAEIRRRLPASRLITVTGPGGIGKTRLALEIAGEIAGRFRDGVRFVDLAASSASTDIGTIAAQVLGVQQSPGKPLLGALCEHVKRRELLLILDNCEHVLAASARVVTTLLQSAPAIRIITTSREPLRADGEQIYVLQSLSLPDEAADFESTLDSEAVQLFVQRLRQQVPEFGLTRERAGVVAEICIRLDGIPLALELAAARARALSVEQIRTRLRERFRLLSQGPVTALPRHRTLRAALDWSHDLLPDDERRALRRLSVFPGSFSLEAAQAVAGDAADDEFALIDVLSQLVARSLVIADTQQQGTRYRLLETTRAYADEKLSEAGETEVRRRRHAHYFATLFRRAPDEWLQKPDAEFRRTYLPELANVRAALEWAFGPGGDAALRVALATGAEPLFQLLGLFGEGIRWLEAAAQQIREETPEPIQAGAWLALGRMLDDEPARACRVLGRAADLFRRLDDRAHLGLTLSRLGRMLAAMGKFEEAEAALEDGRPLLETEGPALFSVYLFDFARLKSATADPVTARHYYEQCLAIVISVGLEAEALAISCNLANVVWALGDIEGAVAAFRQHLQMIRKAAVKTDYALGWALMNFAGVLTERGDLDDALVTMREGLPLVQASGSAWIFFDSIALRAALQRKYSSAALLAGYADAAFARREATRHPIELRHRTRLHALLGEALPAQQLAHLLGEGAKIGDEEACRMAKQA